MIDRTRLIPRIALFSALVYVISWATVYLPNVNLLFFVVFTAGFVWGAVPGLLVGLVGEGLWTVFNPYGPAAIPIAIAQVFGAAACGLVGAWLAGVIDARQARTRDVMILAAAGITCTMVFFLPVTIVDAWVFQPFWPRFWAGMAWTSWSLAVNAVIFPLLFPVTRRLYQREATTV